MRSTRALRLLAALTALTLPSVALHAQRPWHDAQGRDAFQLDFALPFLKGDGHKFFSGTFVPSTSIKMGDGFRFEADLPIMRATNDFGGTTGSKSSLRLGNPYVGIRIGDDAKTVSGTIGVRLPTGQNPKDATGQQAVAAGVASSMEDFSAFAPNIMTVRSVLEVHRVSAKGFLFGVRGGPTLLINTSGDPLKESESAVDWGARFGYEGPKAQLSFGVNGRYLITAPFTGQTCPLDDAGVPTACEIKSFGNRTTHNAFGAIELRGGAVRPRATLSIPLDKDRRKQVASAILGLGLSIAR